jgi:hypothetical protein
VYAERPSGNAVENAVEYDSPTSKTLDRSPIKRVSATQKNLDALGGALLGIVATRATSILDGIVPGFQREFERVKNTQGQI